MRPLESKYLDETVLEKLLAHCHKRRYPARQAIIKPGDEADRLFMIVEGSVSVCMVDSDENEIVLAYLSRGDFIGEVGVFTDLDARNVLVKTKEPSQLAEVSYSRLQHLLDGELKSCASEIYKALGGQLAERLLKTSRKVSQLAFLDVTGRIARTLIELCKEPDAMTHPDGMQIRVTRQELGKIVGCSREMAGRVLKNLELDGLLTAKGKTIVVFGTR